MKKTFSISKTMGGVLKEASARSVEAQKELTTLYGSILAQNDVVSGHVKILEFTDTSVTVELPETAKPSVKAKRR